MPKGKAALGAIIIETKKLGRRYFNQEYDMIALFDNPKEKKKVSDPILAWENLQKNPEKRKKYQK